jgi:glutathione S-transferase
MPITTTTTTTTTTVVSSADVSSSSATRSAVAKPAKLTLWGSKTSRAFRGHWALHELGLEYKKHLISGRGGDTGKPEFLAISPAGMIPVLVDETDGGAEPLVVSESLAILSYLGDAYGDGSLVPRAGTRDRAAYDQYAAYVLIELEKPMWRIVKAAMMKQPLPETILAEEQAHWRRHIAVVEGQLAANGGFLVVGGSFTFADLLLAHVVSWAQRLVAGLLDVPSGVAAHCKTSCEREAFRAAMALPDPHHGGKEDV